MNDVKKQQSWRQKTLFTIQSDVAAEYEAEKIVLSSQNINMLLDEFSAIDNSQIYGLYGTHKSLEDYVNSAFPDQEKFFFDSILIDDDKGKIVLVYNNEIIIPCLIFPLQFFLKKPVNEKSVDLTLFRILQDLTQSIVACPSEQVFEQWYSGENVPFRDNRFPKIAQFVLESNKLQDIEVKQIQINPIISKSYSNWRIFPSSNNSQQFLLFNQIKFTQKMEDEFKKSLVKIIQKTIHELFLQNQTQTQQILQDNLQQELQTTKVVSSILELAKQLKTKVNKILVDTENEIKKNGQYTFYQQQDSSKIIINNLKQQIIIENNQFKLQQSEKLQRYDDFLINRQTENCVKKLDQLFQECQKKIESIITECKKNEINEQNIICHRCKFSRIRETSTEKFSLAQSNNQFIVETSNLQPKENIINKTINQVTDFFMNNQKKPVEVKLVNYFTTKQENSEILVVQKDNKYSVLLIRNNNECKIISCLDNITRPAFLFEPQSRSLFGFNFRSYSGVKLTINEIWKIQDEKTFFTIQSYIMSKVVYIPFDQTFVALNLTGDVFKWQGSVESFAKISCLVKGPNQNELKSQNFIPSKDPGTRYNYLEACPSGKRFYLSNLTVIDIFDINHSLILSIDVGSQFILQQDDFDAFIIPLDEFKWKFQITSAKMLCNLISRQKIKQVNARDEQSLKIGNPFFDVIRGSQVKFGPRINFFSELKSKPKLIIQNISSYEQQVLKYIELIKISEGCIPICEKTIKDKQYINSKTFLRFCYSRVPVQLCTIENNQLTPLIDGFRKPINCPKSLTVTQRAKLLSLGYIEDYLVSLQKKIFVVSIIGRQSSGKSYLLNRIFGTRFTVAASRCTDGIWASVAEINQNYFLILDCEGLFSSTRTKIEETQLLAFLAAICDITILNQDLSFNRHLEELLENLTLAVGRLEGKSLFKGTLLIALRDISQKDSAGAQEQLLKNIETNLRKQNSSFLNKLFNDKFTIILFSNFENESFSYEIEELRKKFLQMSQDENRWQTGKELIQKMKILLIQLETQDDEDTDNLHYRLQVDDIVEKAKRNWISLEKELTFQFKNQQIVNQAFQLYEFNHNRSEENTQFCSRILSQIQHQLNLSTSVTSHNFNQIIIQEFLNELLKQRKTYLIEEFDREIQNMGKIQLDSIANPQKVNIIRYIEEQERLYKICQLQCSCCYLNCSKFQNHSNLLQSEINTKDNKLQIMIKKYETLKLDIQVVKKQIAEENVNEIKLQEQINNLEKNVFHLKHFKHWQVLNKEKQSYADQLKENILCDKNQITNLNFIKLLLQYRKLQNNNIFLCKIFSIDATNQDFIDSKDLFTKMSDGLKMFKVHQDQKKKQIQLLKSEIEAQNSIKYKISIQNQKEEQNLSGFYEQQKHFNALLTNQQREIAIVNGKIEVLKQNQGNLDHPSYQNSLSSLKQYKILLQTELSTLDQQLQRINLSIIDLQEKIQNIQVPLAVKREVQKIISVDENNLLQNCQKMYNEYIQLKKDNTLLNELHDSIDSKQMQGKQFFQDAHKINEQLQQIQIQVCDSFKIALEKISQKKRINQDKIKELFQNDIELILQILSNNNLPEAKQFKEELINLKKNELEKIYKTTLQERKKELEDQTIELKNKQIQKEQLLVKLKEVSIEIEIKQQESLLCDLRYKIGTNYQLLNDNQTFINKQIQMIDKQKTSLNSIALLIQQKQDQIQQIEKESKIIDQNITLIEKTNQSYENFSQISSQYKSTLEQFQSLNIILNDWNKMLELKNDFSQDEASVQALIDSDEINIRKLNQELEKSNQYQQELISIQNDLQLMNELKNQIQELKSQEKQEHSCLRVTHQCDQPCQVCKTTMCFKQAAHQQDHLCQQSKHYCKENCSISSCNQKCKKLFSHDDQHHCGNLHKCIQMCKFCGGDCQFDYTIEHQDHICSLRGCIQKCQLCDRLCMYDHNHSRKEGKIHFCENIHQCNQSCTAPGVCVWEYQEVKKIWKTELSEFEFNYFKLIDGGKQQCQIQIEPGKIQHLQDHLCKIDAHRCGFKCPECDGLCTKSFGHDGFHFAKQHRNKDCQVFTLVQGEGTEVEVNESLQTHKYLVGNSSEPETCLSSCSRRSRSHFHLMICEGGNQCLEKKGNKYSRHQRQYYQGFENIEFDEVQCIEFWKLQKWDHPLNDGDQLANIQSCNYYCPICPDKQKSFCRLPAWHSNSNKYQDHEFWCKLDHQQEKRLQGLDIVFVIDSTSSMSPYIDQAKNMVKNIMKKAKVSAGQCLRFGIVAYRDHPPQDKTWVTLIHQLGTEHQAITFLNSLKAEGGGDIPEAVLDGLWAAVNLSWKKEYDKMMFLIGDAPPHGRDYSDQSSWPDGCPCKIQEKTLFAAMNEKQITFKILELNSALNLMIVKFKQFLELEVITQKSNISFVDQVVNKVCQRIQLREITYRKIDK